MADARSELIETVAKTLGVPPLKDEEVDSVLALAGAAAHGTGDRTAAPLCCFLAGMAAGADRLEALERVRVNVKEATS
jgi:Domain of unknown function (DUF6457)